MRIFYLALAILIMVAALLVVANRPSPTAADESAIGDDGRHSVYLPVVRGAAGIPTPTPTPTNTATPTATSTATATATATSTPSPTPTATNTPTPTATPVSGYSTIYLVSNANDVQIATQHVISDTGGFWFEFWSTIPASTTQYYHLRDMPQVPAPFDGTVSIYSDMPFVADIHGYDGP